MDNIYVIRGRIEELYGKHSKLFDKAFQFILAMITFSMINQNTGFMKSLSSPVISLALAVVATFLPPMVIVVIAAVLVLAHTLAASIGIFAVSAMIFLIMYIFYLRFTPKMAIVVLLTPLAFALKIPVVVPISCALLMSPISMVAVGCGTVVYYIPDHVYFLYQTGTKDGVCCTSYTDCICSENTISGTCCVCTDIYTGKSGADELRNSCVLYGGIS